MSENCIFLVMSERKDGGLQETTAVCSYHGHGEQTSVQIAGKAEIAENYVLDMHVSLDHDTFHSSPLLLPLSVKIFP